MHITGTLNDGVFAVVYFQGLYPLTISCKFFQHLLAMSSEWSKQFLILEYVERNKSVYL